MLEFAGTHNYESRKHSFDQSEAELTFVENSAIPDISVM